jgi:membrane AbrB-like protein
MANRDSKPFTLKSLIGEALTLGAGAAGAGLFLLLNIPGGAMSGSVVAVATLSAFGLATPIGGPLRVLGMASIGVAIGSVVGPDTLDHVAAYPASMALMALCVVAMTLASAGVWRYLMGWAPSMALLASVPGSMGYIVSISMTMGADAAKVAVVQMSRVVFLVTLLPFVIVWEQGGGAVSLAAPTLDSPLMVAAVMAAGIGVGALFLKLGVPGGMILGAIVASAGLHFSGIATGRSPDWLMNGGQILLGSWVGSRFVDFDWSLFFRIIVGTVLAVGAALVVSVAFAWAASQWLGVPFGAALIGYAPGGQEAMVALALVLDVDPIFVATHHLGRYFLINISLPFIIAWMRRTEAKGGE